jgi:ABC-type lipoprotein export system ATPase subunit
MSDPQSKIRNPQSDDVLIHTVNLTQVYGSGENAVRALDGVNLSVQRGELMAVMGPSGCGKSTLLNLLGALDQPTAGEVWVAGENLARLRDVDAFRAQTVGFVFQLHNLLPTLSALENVEVPMQGQSRSGEARRNKSRSADAAHGQPALFGQDRPGQASHRSRHERARRLLELVGLGDRPNALPAQLSGGQRQRVAVARALANDPAQLLADEPTGSLDSQSGEEILDLLAALNRSQGTTILIVTHDRRVAQSTQRILRMSDGRIVADHRLTDPLEEDLHTLADSRLGQAILGLNDHRADFLTPEEQAALRGLLEKLEKE